MRNPLRLLLGLWRYWILGTCPACGDRHPGICYACLGHPLTDWDIAADRSEVWFFFRNG
jgi:hypothetical protein